MSFHLTQVGVFELLSFTPVPLRRRVARDCVGPPSEARSYTQRHDRRGGLGDHQLNPDHDRQLVEYLRFLRRKRDTAIAEVAAEFKEVNESRLFEESYSADEVANILEGLLTSACARRSRRHPAHTKAGTTAA